MLTNVKPASTKNKPCDKCLIHLLPPRDLGIHNCHEALVCKGILTLEKMQKKTNKIYGNVKYDCNLRETGDFFKIKLDEFKPKEEVS